MLSALVSALLAFPAPSADNPLPVVIADPAPPPVVPLIAPLPPPPPARFNEKVREMIEAALASGDEKAIATTFSLALQVNPQAADQIEALQTAHQSAMREENARRERAKRAALAAAGPLEYWDGQAEVGASRSTGNTRNLGIYASLSANREGLSWRHKFIARAELQETNGVTTTQRALLSWQPNYKVDRRLYAFGLAQYEHDQSLGYDNRYTAGGGLGYGIIDRSLVDLDVEGGPALRYTDRADGDDGATLAGRASLSLKWKLSPTLELSQNSAFYYEPGDSNASALTALDTRLLGALKARFSYNLLYESDTPPGRESVDTITRATLVYSF